MPSTPEWQDGNLSELPKFVPAFGVPGPIGMRVGAALTIVLSITGSSDT